MEAGNVVKGALTNTIEVEVQEDIHSLFGIANGRVVASGWIVWMEGFATKLVEIFIDPFVAETIRVVV